LIVDTSVLLAYFDNSEPKQAVVAQLLEQATDDLVVSPYVIAELDYLLASRHGVGIELLALRELGSGAWNLASIGTSDLTQAIGVIERYGDQNIGLADASNVVLADRYSTRTIATLDRRHFDVLRPLRGGRFSVVP